MEFEFADDSVRGARIKVVGVGGAGGNAINRMIEAGLNGVDFIAVNTDAQVLDTNRSQIKVQIGKELTKGLGAGANPDVGRKAIEEDIDEVAEMLTGADMVFVTAGMGGGTGTGAAPVIARMAKEQGALTVAVVTRPFEFEGKKRINRADDGLSELREYVDTLITIPNQRLLAIADRKTLLTDAFRMADDVLYQATKGISDLITVAGLINCDFADVRTVMLGMGDALMGTGEAVGEDRASHAAVQAISSPLLENVSIAGARSVLINVTGGADMTLFDVNDATSKVYDAAGADANIIVGAVIDPTLKNTVRVTVIATGFSEPKAPRTIETNEMQRVEVTADLFDTTPAAAPMVAASRPETFMPKAPTASTAGGNGGNGGNGGRAVRQVVYAEIGDLEVPAYLRRQMEEL